jgi:hypothetical protein
VPAVGEVPRRDEEGEGEPEEEAVEGEDETVIEHDARPAKDGGEDRDGSGEGGEDELWAIGDADNVCVLENVEPD